MPNLINWSAVESRIQRYLRDYEYENRSLALIHVALETHFSIPSDEVSDFITDGTKDRGIDAVYIETVGARQRIHLFTAKCHERFDQSSRNFPSSELDKLRVFLGDLLGRDRSLASSCNPLLFQHVEAVWNLYESGVTPEIVIHLVSNASALLPEEAERFRTSTAVYRYVSLQEDTLDSLAAGFVDRVTPRVDRQLRLVDKNYFERVDGNIRGLIATIEARQLVEFIRDPVEPTRVYPAMFHDNVRVYLTKKNKINKLIRDSALSAANAYFRYGPPRNLIGQGVGRNS